MTNRLRSLLAAPALLLAAVVAGLILPATPVEAVAPESAEYRIDTVHSSLIFKVMHMDVADFYGRFNDVRGTIAFDAEDPTKSKVTVTVAADSVDTANDKRDQHLRSGDFFNAVQFPTIGFTSTGIAKDGEGHTVSGELEMLGKKQPVTATVTHLKTGDIRGKPALGITATFTIQRSDFGMDYMQGGGLGDEVEVILAIEALRG